MRIPLYVGMEAVGNLFKDRPSEWITVFCKKAERRLVKKDKKRHQKTREPEEEDHQLIDADDFLVMCLEALKVPTRFLGSA